MHQYQQARTSCEALDGVLLRNAEGADLDGTTHVKRHTNNVCSSGEGDGGAAEHCSQSGPLD